MNSPLESSLLFDISLYTSYHSIVIIIDISLVSHINLHIIYVMLSLTSLTRLFGTIVIRI
jgi:hypothetical protein